MKQRIRLLVTTEETVISERDLEVKEPASLYLKVPIVEFNKLGEKLLLFVRVVGKGCLRRLIVYWDVEWVIKAHVHELWEACLINLRIIVLTHGFLKLI